ncbi:MAG: ABC transporter [Clostridiales bacterium]|nr:ABC transporter [Clostridiales bacterium]
MRAIIGRELRSYFSSPLGYVFTAVVLLFVGIFTMVYNLKNFLSAFELSLGQMSFVYIIAIPILTMRIIAEEKRQKTDRLLYSLPMGMTRIVFGKYFSALVVLALPVAITGLYPLILSLYGEINFLSAYGSIVGFFLLGAAIIAIGLFVSSVTESQVVAAVLSFVILLSNFFISDLANMMSLSAVTSYVAIAIAIIALAVIIRFLVKSGVFATIFAIICEIGLVVLFMMSRTSFEGLFPKILKGFSLFNRFYSFIGGIFDITSVVYFVMVSLIFVFLTIQSLERRRWN